MTGAELRAGLQALFGEEWRAKGAEELGCNVSTITRQVNGHIPVQGSVKAAVKALLQVKLMRDKHNEIAKASRERKA